MGVTAPDQPTWQDYARALGPPVYALRGQQPRPSFSGHGNPPRSVSLSFGEWGALLVVETSVEPVGDRRILLEIIMFNELAYPLTICEDEFDVVVEGTKTTFRALRVDEACWGAAAAAGDRWIYLR